MGSAINDIINKQHKFFNTRTSYDVSYRVATLKKLKAEIIAKEQAICNALYADFKKPVFESLLSETQFVLAELSTAIKKTRSWAKPKSIWPSLANFPSSDVIYSEPRGTVLIIAPWNYPFQLAIAPLIGAVAAGNTVVLKPSELTPHTSKIITEIVATVFDQNHVTVVEGGVETSQALLKEKWGYIFFTGSVGVGKIIYKAAAEHLTPVTLELGGKNPCIIDETVNIKLTAKRIVWGKFLNGGQTCIAPDYILIRSKIKEPFIEAMQNEIQAAYGENPQVSPDYPRIVNEKNFDRLAIMLKGEETPVGGIVDKEDLYIAPTIVDNPSLDSEVMKDEIFGPILPVIPYEEITAIDLIISHYDKPLSLYVFSKKNSFAKKLIKKYAFGGGAINDTIVHIVNKRMPFGGVGHSGIGAYHGKLSFDIFSHKKSVVKRGTWIDIPIRYAPYAKKINLAKKIKHLF
ncbi:aldehyde dehydrogenase [Leptobacterium sp. I13]|uniref:aldehyde dehydrogenase n=1 Tax=Leptobacterium meishanense TaxID=3128904 RepID=UPI0030EC5873